MSKRLSPLNDLIFKVVFGRDTNECKTILTSLLNDILKLEGKDKIEKITYKNPFNIQEFDESKLSILDIKVETGNKENINIEVQVKNDVDFRKRTLYYWSELYVSTLEKGQAYSNLKKTIAINILDFKLLNDNKAYHNEYAIINKKDHTILLDDLEIHFIELPKVDADILEVDAENNWLLFFKKSDDDGVIEKLMERSETIKMAVEMLEVASTDDIVRQKYLDIEKGRRDYASRIENAEKRGKKLGEKLGEKRGKELGEKLGIELVCRHVDN